MFGEIRNEHGERLDYSFHEGKGDRIVVIGHGVTGNKDRPALVALAEGLAAVGISALRFSFSGNGGSEGEFTDSTITKEVADLGSVIDGLDGYNVCYVGHSMGGAVGVLRTATDERIQALVSLAGMVHTKAFAEREFGDATPDEGFMWDEPDCPLSQAYVDDMATIDSVAKNVPVNLRCRGYWFTAQRTISFHLKIAMTSYSTQTKRQNFSNCRAWITSFLVIPRQLWLKKSPHGLIKTCD